MSFFQEASGISIRQGTFNAVEGNLTNNNYSHSIVEGRKKKHRIHDEFPDIQRGLVYRIKDLDRGDCIISWNFMLQKYETVERTISTAKIHGDSSGSRFTVASYKGQNAQKAWKKDFRQFSSTTDTTKMQLFGINRSSVPLLIFYGELVPLAHFWDRLGEIGRSYAATLAWRVWNCRPSTVWIDPKQGTLVRGLEGPDRKLNDHFWIDKVSETLPSSVELLFQEDICIRYFSRFNPSVKEYDEDGFKVLCIASYLTAGEGPPITHRPHVLSSETNSIIAVGSGSYWDGYGCLADRVVMPDGRTRFTRTDLDSELRLYSNTLSDRIACQWVSQASSVFHGLGISLNDRSSYKLIVPDICLRGSIQESEVQCEQRRSEDPPIYFFLHPLPISLRLEDSSVMPTHTWSYDQNGETSIPRHHCEYLGLPTELSVERFTSKRYHWPSEIYKALDKWQTARGFDPTTTDYARYLEYPTGIFKVTGPAMYEVQLESGSARFEELGAGPSDVLTIGENSCKDEQGQSTICSIWSTLTAPFTYAADEDSKISAALM